MPPGFKYQQLGYIELKSSPSTKLVLGIAAAYGREEEMCKIHDSPFSPTRRTALKQVAAAVAISSGPGCLLRAAVMPAIVDTPDMNFPAIPKDIVKPVVPQQALPMDLSLVRLLPGPFKDAQMRDSAWLLSLEPDRLLSRFLSNAGLPPKSEAYGGWEHTNISGHIVGHYLSACSVMYRATGVIEFKGRVDYMVGELAQCQKHSSSGLLTGMPHGQTVFAKIASTGQVPPWGEAWAPWYNVHKTFAGLRDAYLYCGNEQAKTVFLRFSDWALVETDRLNPDQIATMLNAEHGGMVEVAADAYGMTGDRKYLQLVSRFTHHAIMDPMARGKDTLDGQHSNTNIPKFVGYERVYELTGQLSYHDSAHFFWSTVVRNRTYANGGNGDQEHFFPATDIANHFNSDENTETCCTYNMLKLTSDLFEKEPRSEYAEYAERAMINHILASQEPKYGMVCYFTPFKPGHFRIYGGPENAMWCCSGTGMENHGRYGLSIYYESSDTKVLYINQYIASTLHWKESGLTIQMDSGLPTSGSVKIQVGAATPVRRTFKLRKPSWTSGISIQVNNRPVRTIAGSDGYIVIDRFWQDNDIVELELAMSLRLEPAPHDATKCAIMYGPTLLASPMGAEGINLELAERHKVSPSRMADGARLADILDGWTESSYRAEPALDVPALIGERDTLTKSIHALGGAPASFKTVGLGDPDDVTLVPFYAVHHQRYNLYWNVYTPDEWKVEKERLVAESERLQALDARTIDTFAGGNQQSEIDHQLSSQNSSCGIFYGRTYRDAKGWFSFTMKVAPSTPLQLLCIFAAVSKEQSVKILVGGKKTAIHPVGERSQNQFLERIYDIPAYVVKDQSSIVITFKATPGASVGRLIESRILRKTSGAPS